MPEIEAAAGVVIDRVDEHRTHTDRVGRRKRAEHRVTQQPTAESTAGDRTVDGEPRQQHDGDRVVRHALGHARGRRLALEAGGRQGVIAHDPLWLAMVAEFEADLIRMRTREGMAAARAAGKLRGRKPKLSPRQEAHLVKLYRTGEKNPADLAELFGVGRSTVYRAIERALGRESS